MQSWSAPSELQLEAEHGRADGLGFLDLLSVLMSFEGEPKVYVFHHVLR
jgi:hypothetical protein